MNDPVQMKKVLSLLGLAARGRNLVSGEFSTENAVKDRECMSGDHQRRCIRKHEKVIYR